MGKKWKKVRDVGQTSKYFSIKSFKIELGKYFIICVCTICMIECMIGFLSRGKQNPKRKQKMKKFNRVENKNQDGILHKIQILNI